MNNAICKFSAPYVKIYLMPFYFSNFTFSSVIFWQNRIVKFTLFAVAYKFIERESKLVNGDDHFSIAASQLRM